MGILALGRCALKYRAHIAALNLVIYLHFARAILGNLDRRTVIIGLCFASLTQSIYLFNKIFDQQEDSINFPQERLSGDARGPLFASLILFLAPLMFLLRFPIRISASYIALGLLGALYSAPIGHSGFRLKNYFLLKALATLSGFFWANAVVPMLIAAPLTLQALSAQMAATVPFLGIILVNSLLWDVRDVQGDAAAGVKTLPVLMGTPFTLIVIGLLLILVLAFQASQPAALAQAFMTIVLLGFTLASIQRRGALFFHAIILVQLFFWLAAL